MDLVLEEGQVAVIGCRPENPQSLGTFLFSQPAAENDERHQRLVLIWASRNLTGVIPEASKAAAAIVPSCSVASSGPGRAAAEPGPARPGPADDRPDRPSPTPRTPAPGPPRAPAKAAPTARCGREPTGRSRRHRRDTQNPSPLAIGSRPESLESPGPSVLLDPTAR